MTAGSRSNARRIGAGVAVSAALLVPLAAFGSSALAKGGPSASEYQYGSAGHQYRVQVCHLTGSRKHPARTIWVAGAAVKAHLRHGDHLGACTGTETPRQHHAGASTHGKSGATTHSSPAPQAGTEHGNAGDHGNAGGNGKGNGHGK